MPGLFSVLFLGGPCLSYLSDLSKNNSDCFTHYYKLQFTDLPTVLLHRVFQLVPLAETTVKEARLALVIPKTSQTSVPQSNDWIRATNTTSHSVAYWNKRNVRTVNLLWLPFNTGRKTSVHWLGNIPSPRNSNILKESQCLEGGGTSLNVPYFPNDPHTINSRALWKE